VHKEVQILITAEYAKYAEAGRKTAAALFRVFGVFRGFLKNLLFARSLLFSAYSAYSGVNSCSCMTCIVLLTKAVGPWPLALNFGLWTLDSFSPFP
jgi:hypothetical protein